eukprot:7177727-Pyramimonas_sp.AAC.1
MPHACQEGQDGLARPLVQRRLRSSLVARAAQPPARALGVLEGTSLRVCTARHHPALLWRPE